MLTTDEIKFNAPRRLIPNYPNYTISIFGAIYDEDGNKVNLIYEFGEGDFFKVLNNEGEEIILKVFDIVNEVFADDELREACFNYNIAYVYQVGYRNMDIVPFPKLQINLLNLVTIYNVVKRNTFLRTKLNEILTLLNSRKLVFIRIVKKNILT